MGQDKEHRIPEQAGSQNDVEHKDLLLRLLRLGDRQNELQRI